MISLGEKIVRDEELEKHGEKVQNETALLHALHGGLPLAAQRGAPLAVIWEKNLWNVLPAPA